MRLLYMYRFIHVFIYIGLALVLSSNIYIYWVDPDFYHFFDRCHGNLWPSLSLYSGRIQVYLFI